MKFFVGTSGYSYKEWKGTFYPEKLPQKKMLSYYGEHFSTVEINNTFRQLPSNAVLESWTQQVPDEFQFVLKAPQKITHFKRLKNVSEDLEALLEAAGVLEQRRGPLLFQLPPNFKKDLPLLEAFLEHLDARSTAAFEFRHESWFDDEVYDCLHKKSCALCIADSDDAPCETLISTANWGYLRFRREAYTKKKLAYWVEKIRSQPWATTFVFFKHEDTGTGPTFASQFLKEIES
jgi:uncharacterized protein YecE (DUF72 family)